MPGPRLVWMAAALVAVVATGCGGGPSANGGRLEVSVLGSTTNVRLDQPFPAGAPEARLLAARNEFESAQIAVEAQGGGVKGVDVSLAKPLSGPGGSIPADDVTIYREGAYTVDPTAGTPPSDGESADGLWPDALIPQRDYLYGERRAAFPWDIPDGGRMLAWVDVLVPANATPGVYRGELAVSAGAGRIARIPLVVDVVDLRLPSTPTLTTALGTSPDAPCQAFNDSDCDSADPQSWALHALFEREALDNRVTIFNPFPTHFSQAPSTAQLQSHLGSLLAGTGAADPAGTRPQRLAGAQMTSVGAFWQCLDRGAACLGTWRQSSLALGLKRRFFVFVCDEPNEDAAAWAVCDRRSEAARRTWTGAAQLITAPIQAARLLGGAALANADILAPIVNDLDDRDGTYAGDQRRAYHGFLAAGAKQGVASRRLWTYVSCVSDGCGDVSADSYSEGWPTLAIDAPASEARAIGWLAFGYGLSGFLYFDTTRMLTTAWTNQYESGSNGDGTLFYPGGPAGAGGGPAIGGTHPIPIESMRLKRLRDGIEDYEYLHALASRRGQAAADDAVARLLGPLDSAAYSTAVSQAALDEQRCRVASEIDPQAASFCKRSATLEPTAASSTAPS